MESPERGASNRGSSALGADGHHPHYQPFGRRQSQSQPQSQSRRRRQRRQQQGPSSLPSSPTSASLSPSRYRRLDSGTDSSSYSLSPPDSDSNSNSNTGTNSTTATAQATIQALAPSLEDRHAGTGTAAGTSDDRRLAQVDDQDNDDEDGHDDAAVSAMDLKRQVQTLDELIASQRRNFVPSPERPQSADSKAYHHQHHHDHHGGDQNSASSANWVVELDDEDDDLASEMEKLQLAEEQFRRELENFHLPVSSQGFPDDSMFSFGSGSSPDHSPLRSPMGISPSSSERQVRAAYFQARNLSAGGPVDEVDTPDNNNNSNSAISPLTSGGRSGSVAAALFPASPPVSPRNRSSSRDRVARRHRQHPSSNSGNDVASYDDKHGIDSDQIDLDSTSQRLIAANTIGPWGWASKNRHQHEHSKPKQSTSPVRDSRAKRSFRTMLLASPDKGAGRPAPTSSPSMSPSDHQSPSVVISSSDRSISTSSPPPTRSPARHSSKTQTSPIPLSSQSDAAIAAAAAAATAALAGLSPGRNSRSSSAPESSSSGDKPSSDPPNTTSDVSDSMSSSPDYSSSPTTSSHGRRRRRRPGGFRTTRVGPGMSDPLGSFPPWPVGADGTGTSTGAGRGRSPGYPWAVDVLGESDRTSSLDEMSPNPYYSNFTHNGTGSDSGFNEALQLLSLSHETSFDDVVGNLGSSESPGEAILVPLSHPIFERALLERRRSESGSTGLPISFAGTNATAVHHEIRSNGPDLDDDQMLYAFPASSELLYMPSIVPSRDTIPEMGSPSSSSSTAQGDRTLFTFPQSTELRQIRSTATSNGMSWGASYSSDINDIAGGDSFNDELSQSQATAPGDASFPTQEAASTEAMQVAAPESQSVASSGETSVSPVTATSNLSANEDYYGKSHPVFSTESSGVGDLDYSSSAGQVYPILAWPASKQKPQQRVHRGISHGWCQLCCQRCRRNRLRIQICTCFLLAAAMFVIMPIAIVRNPNRSRTQRTVADGGTDGLDPTALPSQIPTVTPSRYSMPSSFSSSLRPTLTHSSMPTTAPVASIESTSSIPSIPPRTPSPTSPHPSSIHFEMPIVEKSVFPARVGSTLPSIRTEAPSSAPEEAILVPSIISFNPTNVQTGGPSTKPTRQTSSLPSVSSSDAPSISHSSSPTVIPTSLPTTAPIKPTRIPTNPPSMAETLVNKELFDFLVSASLDGGIALRNTLTPQFQAYEWLAENVNLASYNQTRLIQRYVLAVLYYSTKGERWSNNRRWLTDADECTWFSRSSDAVCGDNSTLQRIDLYYNNLDGFVPRELGLLSEHIQVIDLTGGPQEALRGPVPSDLGLLTAMTDFRIRSNYLAGTLPTEFGAWTNIRTVDLAYNRFSGSLIPNIGRWTNLQQINVEGNLFQGSIPRQIGESKRLITMTFDNNLFDGVIPTTVGRLTQLETFSVEGNLLTGIPTEIGLMEGLRFLLINSNDLQGTLPTEIGQLTQLRRLLANINQFGGPIPSELGQLRRLSDLDLSENRFTGTIPPEMGLIDGRLRSLRLNGNQLDGTVPIEFQYLSHATEIYLQGNLLSGTVPTAVCKVYNMTLPALYMDCDDVICPCCTFCCYHHEVTCACRYANTSMSWLCY